MHLSVFTLQCAFGNAELPFRGISSAFAGKIAKSTPSWVLQVHYPYSVGYRISVA